MMKLDSLVLDTKISPQFECQGQGSKVKVARNKRA